MEYNENDARLGADIKELKPSPGSGVAGGGTENPLVTDLGEGPRGTPIDVANPEKSGLKVEQNLVNFLKGLLIKGKPLEEYIDSEGGVTEAELVAALANYYKKSETYSKTELNPLLAKIGNIDIESLPKETDEDPFSLPSESVERLNGQAFYDEPIGSVVYPIIGETTIARWFYFDGEDFRLVSYSKSSSQAEWSLEKDVGVNGTKLYKHAINVYTDASEQIDFEVVSTRESTYSYGDIPNGRKGVLAISIEVSSDFWGCLPAQVIMSNGFTFQAYLDVMSDPVYESNGLVTTITDTVTAL